ncbi:stAR-related lipid transfer protein 5 isoform X1 [Phascolarctos cinereus]|uniref:StAR-related lipid transfer protein 5 isoform X1 n=1 Tax=Phascolarctos cinereus TaxID=38626 RepID=A0A6P5IHJ2_PHACI|nr:stAR-related lipid transfer protein 5 isoform X1 [Phascolarctos cinereus]
MDPARAAEVSGVVAEKMLHYRRDESGWKTCRSGKGVTISWRPSTEFPGNLYKGEGIIYGTPEEVWKFLLPADNGLRAKWDENVKDLQVLELIKDDLLITRTITPSAAMKLISPRDFVDLVLIKKYDDGTITSNATYLDYPSCPPQSGYVRGFNHPCGCFCEPVPGEPNKTHVVSFFQTDLSGYLPQKVVNSFFPHSMAELYNNLQKAVNKLQE